jgi:hypothetical protein
MNSQPSPQDQDARLSTETYGALYQSVYGLMQWDEVHRPQCLLQLLAMLDAEQDDFLRSIMIEICESFCFITHEGSRPIIEQFKQEQMTDEPKPGTDVYVPGDDIEARLVKLFELNLPAEVDEKINDLIVAYQKARDGKKGLAANE